MGEEKEEEKEEGGKKDLSKTIHEAIGVPQVLWPPARTSFRYPRPLPASDKT